MAFWNKTDMRTKPSTLYTFGLVLLLALLAFFIFKIATPRVDSGTYQLVRVESGESYVGKLSHADDDYIELNDVYVYQAPSGSEATDKEEDAASPTTPQVGTDNDNLTLLPVSSIEGTMYVSRQKVVYWGNLSNEGPVVNAIKADKNKKD